MRLLPIVFGIALPLAACQTRPPQTTDRIGGKNFVPFEVRSKLPSAPFPKTTPYDANPALRGAYLSGFSSGWDFAVSGDILRGTLGTPLALSPKASAPWQAGASQGMQLGRKQLEARLKIDHP